MFVVGTTVVVISVGSVILQTNFVGINEGVNTQILLCMIDFWEDPVLQFQ